MAPGVLVRPPDTVDSRYLAAFLRSPGAREWLDTDSTGSLALRTISLEVLGMLPVSLPDLDAQRSIGEAMELFGAFEAGLLKQLAETRDIRDKALNSFLRS